MHLLDMHAWRGKVALTLRTVLITFVPLALLNGAVLSLKSAPSTGVFLSILLVPIYTTFVHYIMASLHAFVKVYPGETIFEKFAKTCTVPLAVLAMLTAAWWLFWVNTPGFLQASSIDDNWWTRKTQAQMSNLLECPRFAYGDGSHVSHPHHVEKRVEAGRLVPCKGRLGWMEFCVDRARGA